MKIIETVFKFFEKKISGLCAEASRTGRGNKLLRRHSIVIAFSAILIPCFLQFYLIAFAQEGPGFVDRTFMFVEIPGKCIKSESVVANGRNVVGKRSLVCFVCSSEEIPAISFYGEDMSNKRTNRRSYDPQEKTKKNICGITHEGLNLGIMLLMAYVAGSFTTGALVWAAQR